MRGFQQAEGVPGELPVEGRVKNLHGQLKVEPVAARVQVGRAEVGIGIVYQKKLGVVKGGRLEKDAHAAF